MEMDSSYAITRTVLVYLGSKVTIGKLALVLPYSSPLISSLGERPDYNFLLLKRETMLVYIPHLRGAVLVCLLRTNSSESRHDLLPPATISTGQDTLLDVYTPTILYSNTLPRISLLDLGTSLLQFVLDGFDTLIATATIESLRIFDDVAKEALSSVLLTCDSDFGGFVSQLSEDGLD
ncbi:predicted protein [Arabidopsis lyrata subsp. lyrata]|uniref:Predicted protein n=1 Tax=Arabidopsis lyrata subsp. lyrata TaxID=81972 RepID=D7M9R0_ARALL|nr:predicted protein [Arabidopsis lyrata subsp. lyrata]